MTFTEEGNTEKFTYKGNSPTNLYLYTETGRVNVYSLSINADDIDYGTGDLHKIWDFSNDNLNGLGNITEYIEVDGLTIKGLPVDNYRERDVDVVYHYDDDQYNIEYTHELKLNGKGSTQCRSVEFYLPKDTRIYVTAQYNNDLSSIERSLAIFNEFGYKIDDGFEFGNVPSTQMYEYTGDGENICLFSTNRALSIRKIEIISKDYGKPVLMENKTWNLGSSLFENYVPGTEIDGLTMGGSLVNTDPIPPDGPNRFSRYLWVTSGNFNREYACFDVAGECSVTVVARSHSDTIRTLAVVDKFGCLVGTIDVDGQLDTYTLEYTGDVNTLYIWSLDSSVDIFAIAVSQNGTPFSIDKNDNTIIDSDEILSGSAIF